MTTKRMSEKQWLTTTDPGAMLRLVHGKFERKERLFACACCRRIWELMPAAECQAAVDEAERLADGVTRQRQLSAARKLDWFKIRKAHLPNQAYGHAAQAAREAAIFGINGYLVADTCASAVFRNVENQLRGKRGWTKKMSKAYDDEQAAQAALARDIFGNPFRRVTLKPTWRTSNVASLTQGIYEERRFADLPILADAFEEAGCTDEAILSHCRGPGPHVRGCWVVDLLLGKE